MAQNPEDPYSARQKFGLIGELNINDDSDEILVHNTLTGMIDKVSKSSIISGSAQNLDQVLGVGNISQAQIVLYNSGAQRSIVYDNNFIEFAKTTSGIDKTTTLKFANPTNNVELTIPAKTTNDTFAMLSDIGGGSGFVPYTGATANLDLGNFDLTAFNIRRNSDGGLVIDENGAIHAYDNIQLTDNVSGFTALVTAPTLSADRAYQFPNGSGTLALIETVENRFIPLGGTDVGKPITGDLELSGAINIINGSDTTYSTISSSDSALTMLVIDGSEYSNINIYSGLLSQSVSSSDGNSQISLSGDAINTSVHDNSTGFTSSLQLSSAGITIGTDNTASRGIIGNEDYTANITNLDYVQKIYVDNAVTGLYFKTQCLVATTANITLSGLLTLDGVTLVAGNRVLVKNQTTASQNGIYVAASGAWSRATDADTGAELANKTIPVTSGTVNQDTWWTITNDSITLGTTAITFTQTGGMGTYTNGTGIVLTGNVFSYDNTYIGTAVATALSGKQATLVSGTNIKTVNGTTLLGSGDLTTGTVTTVSVVTANGVSGSVANASTTPAITLTLGAITPSSVTTAGNVNLSAQTASTIAVFDSSKNIVSAATATYPSLTELAYVKGLTSAAQTQIDSKQAALSGTGLVISTAGVITYLAIPASNTSYLRGDGTFANTNAAVRATTIGTTDTNITQLSSSTRIDLALLYLQNQINAMNVANDTTTAFTKATLNSTYPTAVVGTRIICKNIGSGMIYTKASGTDWVSTSGVLMT